MHRSTRTLDSLCSPHLAFKAKWAMYKQVEKLNFLRFHLQSFISIKCLWKFPVVWAAGSPPTNYLLSTYGAKTSKLRRGTGPLADSWSVTHVVFMSRLPKWKTSLTCLGSSCYRKVINKKKFRRKGVEWVFITFSAKPTKSEIEFK